MAEFYKGRRLRYEIHVLSGKRWQLAETMGDDREKLGRDFAQSDFEALEKSVLAKAGALLQGSVEAVKVLRERTRADGFATASEIFFRQASGKVEAPPSVSKYEGTLEACTTAAELCRRPACQAIGALLRSWLDRNAVTAIELVHFYPYIRKLQDAGSLLQGALHQAATAQARGGGTVKARLDALQGLVGEAEREARDALAEKRLPEPADGDLGVFAERIAARFEGERRRWHLVHGVIKQFQGSPSLFARLDFAFDALEAGAPPEIEPLLDELVAGCLDSPQTVMDLLGAHPDLASALVELAALGTGVGSGGSGAETTQRLRTLISAGRLPLAAASLWDRAVREFGRNKPLSRRDERREWELSIKTSDALAALAPPPFKPRIEAAGKDRLRRIREASALND